MLAGVFSSCAPPRRRSPRRPPRFPCSVVDLLPLVLLLLGAAPTYVAADGEAFDPLIRLPHGGDGDGDGRMWPPTVFSVDRFGAVGDGLHNDTEAFLLAWRTACSMRAPAVLKVPARKTYLVGPIDFPGPCVSNLTLSILGTIIAPNDPHMWHNLNTHKWLYFHGINYLNVRGGGTINGMGERWWAQSCKVNKKNPCRHAPTAITFHRCKDLRIQNLMLVNSQQMHIAFTESVRVKASGLKVIAPVDSPNTDGIHISSSVYVEIKNSDIKTGDDCISIVSNSSKVRIRNIVCGPGHGISIGSLGKFNSSSSVSDVHVDNVIFSNSENGFRIKTWQGGTGSARKMFFRNAVMVNVLHPIIIDQYYCDSRRPCPNQTSAVKVEQVSFEGIRGTSGTRNAVTIACSDTLPCEKIFLKDIQLSLKSGGYAAAYCWKAYGSSHGFVDPPSCLQGHGRFSNRYEFQPSRTPSSISKWIGNTVLLQSDKLFVPDMEAEGQITCAAAVHLQGIEQQDLRDEEGSSSKTPTSEASNDGNWCAPLECGKQDVQQMEPYNGIVFETMEAAKIFYNNYAKHEGFGISISDSRKIKDLCIYRKFSCHKSGHAKRNKNTVHPRDSCKVGCQASVKVKLDKGTKKFTMYDVKIEHNHILQPAGAVYLRSHRKICTPEKAEIMNMRNVGIPPTKIMSAMARRSGGIRNLSWTEKDCRNFLDRERQSQLKDGDANTMLTYFQTMQAKDPTFLYNVALNENGTLRHVFWIDGRSRTACTYFSDVVCFDTTYLTNTYQMPFAPIVGVNHHGQSILLGCALLSNEKIDSFIWLFNCWLQANMGIHPKAIITDQDKAMEAAIAEVFPNTRHRFCLWHILKKIPEKIGHICTSNLEFMNDFDACIYDSNSTHDFEEKWDVLMSKYESAKKNEWLEGLYECRRKWVPIFLKDTFFAGMSSSQRSESINHFFDGFVTAKTTLSEFVQKFALALERRFDAENEADMKSTDTEPFLRTSSPFEKQAGAIYTRSIFQKFQHELIEVAACQPSFLSLDDKSFTLRVKSFERINFKGVSKVVDKVCTVIYNKEQQEVECSCSCFQFKGYLCRHAIAALQYSGIESIPEKYFLKRWRKDMRYRHASDSFNIPIEDKKSSSSMYNLLIYRFMKVAEAASCTEESYDKALAEIPNLLERVMQPVNGNTAQSNVNNTQVADPPRAATKGRKREKRIQSALEKIRKRSRSSKNFNKNGDLNAGNA